MHASDDKTLYLIDGHSLTFKAYYAVRGLTNARGEPTGAVFGFLRMLLKLLDDSSPQYLAVVFDTGKPTFRNELYDAYKANREAPPPDFGVQMGWVLQLLQAMGIAVYSMDGFEADDLIGTMARTMAEQGRAVIVSADKDLLQLVTDRVHLLRPGLNETILYDPTRVREQLGIRPDQMIDWLALVGDSSDNIPGVPGIGQKTATTLLQEYDTLERLLARAGELKRPKQRQALLENAEQARLAQRLAAIDCDVPLVWSPADCRLPENLFSPEAAALMAELGFHSLLREKGIEPARVAAAAPAAAHPPETRLYASLTEEAELRAWVEGAMQAEWLALDTETTSTDSVTCRLVGISLCHEEGKAVYIPVGHRIPCPPRGNAAQAAPEAGNDQPEMALNFEEDALLESQLPIAMIRRLLEPLLAGRGPRLAGHHAKFDWKVLRQAGFNPAPPAFDSMIASYLLDPDKATGHGLKTLGKEICGCEMRPITELIGTGRGQVTIDRVALDDVRDYACLDADITFRLRRELGRRLDEHPRLRKLMDELEMPLVEVLIDVELGGFTVDPTCLNRLGGELAQHLADLSRRIWEAVGHPFNIGSPRQVAQVLFEELGLKPGKKLKTGYSTNEAELERLARDHPVARLILEHRGYEKLKSTYVDSLPKLVNPKTGRIHTSFHQTIAATGRLSSTDPNLQNIPIRSEMGRAIRRAFVADGPQCLLLKADYSQIELRILAHISRDPALLAAYREGRDIHRQTASEVFGVAPEQVDREMRSRAKVINFGIIYGMSPHGLAQQLEISRVEAAEFIDRYFNTYPGVRRWIEELLAEARRTGYVETLMGRRRLVGDLNQRNRMVREAAERVAVNTPIQGTSADMIKRAMILIHRRLNEVAPGARMVCQVHDELVFSVPRDQLKPAEGFIREQMTGALPLAVPVEVEIHCAPNWAEC